MLYSQAIAALWFNSNYFLYQDKSILFYFLPRVEYLPLYKRDLGFVYII